MHSITQVLLLEILKYWRYPKILYLKILDKHIQATCSQHVVQLFHYTIKWVVKLWFLPAARWPMLPQSKHVQHLYMFIQFYSYPAFYQHVPHLIFFHFLYIFIHFHSFSQAFYRCFIMFLRLAIHVAQATWQINGAALWSCCPRCWQAPTEKPLVLTWWISWIFLMGIFGTSGNHDKDMYDIYIYI